MNNKNNLIPIKCFFKSIKRVDKNSLKYTNFIKRNSLAHYKSPTKKIININSNRIFPKTKYHLTALKSSENKQKIKSKKKFNIRRKSSISDEIDTKNFFEFNDTNIYNTIFAVKNINNNKKTKTINLRYNNKFNFSSDRNNKKIITKKGIDCLKQAFSPNKLNSRILETTNNNKSQNVAIKKNKDNLENNKSKTKKNKTSRNEKNFINTNLTKKFIKCKISKKKIKNYEISKTERSKYSKIKIKNLLGNNTNTEKIIQNINIEDRKNSKSKKEIKNKEIKDSEMKHYQKLKFHPLSFQLMKKKPITQLKILVKNKNISPISQTLSTKISSIMFKIIPAHEINKLFPKVDYSKDASNEDDSKMINYDLGNMTGTSLSYKKSIPNFFYANNKNSELEKTIDQITKETKEFFDESRFCEI